MIAVIALILSIIAVVPVLTLVFAGLYVKRHPELIMGHIMKALMSK